MEEIITACQDAKRPTTDMEKVTASWCAGMEETIEETLTACQQGRVAEAEEEATKIRENYLIQMVDTVCPDANRPAANTDPMVAIWCAAIGETAKAMKQGRFTEVKEKASKTAERFLVHLKDNDYDAAKELSVGSARSYLDGADNGITDPAWASVWRKIRGGISSWKMDGWSASIGKLYSGYSAQSAVQERHKPVLRARDEHFVILAYTLKHSGESDTGLDFLLRPTEQGWRISEISFVGDKPAQQVVLRLQEIISDRRDIDGVKHLVIEGEFANPSGQPQSIPPMVATLLDSDGSELKRWIFHAEATVVPAGGSVPFQTSTANPPSGGEINLYFLR